MCFKWSRNGLQASSTLHSIWTNFCRCTSFPLAAWVSVSNQACSPIISPSLVLPHSLSLTLQGEATGLMSLNEECYKNPERGRLAGGGSDWTICEHTHTHTQQRERKGEREGCCLHCNIQVLSQSQTRKNLFRRIVSFLFETEGYRRRVWRRERERS